MAATPKRERRRFEDILDVELEGAWTNRKMHNSDGADTLTTYLEPLDGAACIIYTVARRERAVF